MPADEILDTIQGTNPNEIVATLQPIGLELLQIFVKEMLAIFRYYVPRPVCCVRLLDWLAER